MHQGYCKCGHHKFAKVLVLLAWVAGILFFWGSWAGRTFWGFDAVYWAWSVIVLVLLTKTTGYCGCCGGSWKMSDKMMGKGMVCSHEAGCMCGDCDRCK